MPDQPMSMRCSPCGINWPRIADFCKCPECGGDTSVMNSTPLPLAEAYSLKRHAEFERYFEKWDRERWKQQQQELSSLAP